VRFQGPARDALIIPADAVRTQGQIATVFVVEGDRARLRLIRTSAGTIDGSVEVSAGLDPGEWVIVSPPPALVDGHPVRRTGADGPAGARPAGEVVR
jgi:hypothetical protein